MKIALVEFLNAFPLYYALKHGIIANEFEFESYPPSVCASLLRKGEVDVGNVPIVEYTHCHSYRIIDRCCIASGKEVKSVVLFLNKPIEKVRTVKLDRNSNTSVVLTRVLFAFKYKLSVDYSYDTEADCELVIGDKALGMIKNDSRERLDLAVEWRRMTGLPFVFAAWITAMDVDSSVSRLFVDSKEWGKKHIKEICSSSDRLKSLVDVSECVDYLNNNIDYDLTDDKVESIRIFFDYASRIGAIGEHTELKLT